MKYLIITADDLGLTKSVNEGIAKAYREGIVNSISVIPTGEAFADALQTIKDLGLKEVGAHLSLTETKPLLSSSKFYKNHNQFFLDLFLKKVDTGTIYKELKAQLELLNNIGIKITHINSHEHIHIIPQIFNIFIQLAKEYNIPAIRFPIGDRLPAVLSIKENYKSFVLNYFAGRIKNDLSNSGLAHTDFFLGLLDAGKLTEDKLIGMLGDLKDGATELVCHPGFLSPEVLDSYKWHIGAEAELFALTDPRIKGAIKSNDIRLITYGELLSVRN